MKKLFHSLSLFRSHFAFGHLGKAVKDCAKSVNPFLILIVTGVRSYYAGPPGKKDQVGARALLFPTQKKMHSHEPKTLDEKSEGSSRDEMDKVFVRVTINRVILAEHFNGHSGPRATLTFALKKKYCPNQLSLFLLPSCAALAERAQQESRQPGYS
jgi:hypothetical protein